MCTRLSAQTKKAKLVRIILNWPTKIKIKMYYLGWILRHCQSETSNYSHVYGQEIMGNTSLCCLLFPHIQRVQRYLILSLCTFISYLAVNNWYKVGSVNLALACWRGINTWLMPYVRQLSSKIWLSLMEYYCGYPHSVKQFYSCCKNIF